MHTERKVHCTQEGLMQGEGSELQEKPADSENNHTSATGLWSQWATLCGLFIHKFSISSKRQEKEKTLSLLALYNKERSLIIDIEPIVAHFG